jgi:uncharacterized protein affecting Mg2+/Co2+ transport
MAQNIILKRSSLSGKVPTTSSLDLGEIALNTYDGRAFIHKSGSEESIEQIVVTNSITTGSINITYTGSFGEIDVTNDLNVGDSIYVTNDIVGGGDVDVVGSVTASFFVGDGSQLTGIDTSTDTEIPANEWDYNLPDSGSLSDGNNTSIKYTIDFQAEGYDVRPVGYQTFITNNNGSTEIIPGTDGILFIVNNQEVGRIGVDGIIANIPSGTISGSSQLTSSFDQRYTLSGSIPNIPTGSFATTGSNTFNGNETISGSLFISGTTELGGNIVPKTARGATLGTSERPFSDIFVSSGSINIASDTPGDPNTTLSNIGGNILVSAGGMRLVGDASFIAATGSFQYISGSMVQIGNYTQTGNYTMVGNKIVTGSIVVTNGITGSIRATNGIISGSSQLTSSFDLRYLVTGSVTSSINALNLFTASENTKSTTLSTYTSSLNIWTSSVATTGSNAFNGNQVITGSLTVSSTLVNNGALALTSGSNLTLGTGSLLIVSSSQYVSGSIIVTGSVNVQGNYYLNGNKQYNYGAFSDLTTQSGSANTAYAMKLNTTDLASGFSIVDGTKITATNTGIYNLQFSSQLEQTVNEVAEVSIWLRKNGINVVNSNTEISIEKAGKLVAAWNYMIELNTNQYLELVWSSTSSNTQLHYHTTQSTPTRPATPSVIVTMTQIA